MIIVVRMITHTHTHTPREGICCHFNPEHRHQRVQNSLEDQHSITSVRSRV